MNRPHIDAVWQPPSAGEMCKILAPLGVPWWVAGGVAIDLFLGEPSRAHADIDTAMRRADALALRALGDRFELSIAHDGTLIPWEFEPLRDEHHQFWVRRRGEEAWAFEVLFELERDGAWAYRRDPRITLPWERFGTVSADGIPHLAPEVALFYKTKEPRERDIADFEFALPRLSARARAWLYDVLAFTQPQHPWLAALASETPASNI
jgi:hypothetical protein